MGSCVSVHKDSEAALKLRLRFGSKTDKLVTPSPVKEKPPIVADHVIKSRWSPPRPVPDFGSKEQTFFDSQTWLESDCEDDFLSVNGDFTPSRGNTPVHHSFSVGTPRTNSLNFAERTSNSTPDPSSTDKKMKLAELFKDTVLSDQDEKQNAADNQDGAIAKVDSKTTTLEVPSKSGNGTTNVPGANSAGSGKRSPNGDFKLPGEKSGKSAQCCLPRLRSYSERKKRTSPARSVG
ncbi:hypothetical protein ACH5RR_010955 [Cinchona calisaya]|uniref:Uncharacterized protein n=1 Tax=Cinchona calisaya TaxID=153742 RepID=A0ABD3A3L9_9GENT